MRSVLIENAAQVLTMACGGRPKVGSSLSDPGALRNGDVAIREGRIVAVGQRATQAVERDQDVDVIDANRGLVMPGFVDPHTHLIFAGSRAREFEARLMGKQSYMDALNEGTGGLVTVRATRAASDADLSDLLATRLKRLLNNGTTTIEVKSGYGLTIDEELRHLRLLQRVAATSPMRVVPTGLAAHFRPPEFTDDIDAYVDQIVDRFIPLVAAEGLATSIDVFCDPKAYSVAACERILTSANRHGLRARVHADQLNYAGGAELAARFNAISADHLGHISEAGIEAIAKSETIAVLIPGSLFFVPGESTPPVQRLLEAGVAIAISSDYNPGTSPITSQAVAVGLACVLFRISVAAALAATTINAAFAVGLGHDTGSLELGKRGDVLVIEAEDYREIAYRFGENLVRTVIVGGVPILERPGIRPL